MVSTGCIENEITLALVGRHALSIGGTHKHVSSLLFGKLFLSLSGAESIDGVSECLGEFDAHSAESSDTNDTNSHLLASDGSPMAKRVPEGDSGTHDRTYLL